jgi:hypothetical protein
VGIHTCRYRLDTLILSSYKANPASLVTTVINEETGEEKTRLINRMRWKGLSPTSIPYDSPAVSYVLLPFYAAGIIG